MKTRFKILLFNVFVSVLYYVFVLLFLTNINSIEEGVVDFITAIFKTIILIIYYNWIHVIWGGLILLGIIKKKKELIIGGVISVGSSLLIFLLFILCHQI
ncbi:MAG: hypothetical protein QMB65_01580 [Vicingaceae bacterium]